MTNVTIEVRIRHIDEAKAFHLMGWDPTQLDRVIPLLKSWGIQHELGYEYGTEADLSGQFVIEGGAAFFEVLIEDPEPA